MILFHTLLSIAILVGLFDGINRETTRLDKNSRYDDLTRRGFIPPR